MDDGRVSYEEAVEAIRRLGYAGVEREEDKVTLYADDVPYGSVKNVHYPLMRSAERSKTLFGILIMAIVLYMRRELGASLIMLLNMSF